MERYYGFDLDEIYDDLYCKMEEVQDGLSGHTIAIKEESMEDAVEKLVKKLKPFFLIKCYRSDEHGRPTD